MLDSQDLPHHSRGFSSQLREDGGHQGERLAHLKRNITSPHTLLSLSVGESVCSFLAVIKWGLVTTHPVASSSSSFPPSFPPLLRVALKLH